MVIGKSVPVNAPLMQGTDRFQIEFNIGELIELSLKQFINICMTASIFIKADIECLPERKSAISSGN
jgi:hypothetical protein